MNSRKLGANGAGAAAAIIALVGLASQAKSDNQPNPASPVLGAPTAPAAPSGSDWNSIADAFDGFKADTKPSRDVTMQFPAATEIREVKAVGGQRVKKGDVLIRARDSDIIAAIAQQKDLAENNLEIVGAEKQADLAKFKFERIRGSGQYSPTEYREAEITAEVARVQADQAKKNKIQQELKLKQSEASYERYFLEAPFDGIIEEVMVEVGEGVTEQTKVVHLVNTEKLWLDPYAATPQTIRLGLKENSPAWVLVDMPDMPRMVKGHVVYVSPVADSVSQTRRVRVEIDNPEGWPAGTQARVRFTDPGTEWEKYQPKPQVSAAPEAPKPPLASAAPEGPKSVAVGVSPRNETPAVTKPWKGDTSAEEEYYVPWSGIPRQRRLTSVASSIQPAKSQGGRLGGFTFDIVVGEDGKVRVPSKSDWNLPRSFNFDLLDSWPSRPIQLPPDPIRDEQLGSGAYIPGPPGTKIGEPRK